MEETVFDLPFTQIMGTPPKPLPSTSFSGYSAFNSKVMSRCERHTENGEMASQRCFQFSSVLDGNGEIPTCRNGLPEGLQWAGYRARQPAVLVKGNVNRLIKKKISPKDNLRVKGPRAGSSVPPPTKPWLSVGLSGSTSLERCGLIWNTESPEKKRDVLNSKTSQLILSLNSKLIHNDECPS